MSALADLFGSFLTLPYWIRAGLAVFVALGIVGTGMAFSPVIALIVVLGLLFVVLALGLYVHLLHRSREKRASLLGGELGRHAAVAPRSISEPARRARLDDLRQQFEKGLAKFRSVGKDIYKLPWYVIIGEPGAGKTEAIRHSDIGFPPGLQDEFQGVGGTINMNWWFSNSAVLLDTAGRLVFEEVPPGATSEWREFLELLKKNRPNCPVNGLLLVIPVESVIKDSEAAVTKRAGWIARQLDQIQRTLDIRFPVFVVVSKCDLLNGFREFFEDLNDPRTQHQMMGWSNPDPLDQPFRPELVDEHLRTVAERLRRHRLALLQDPVARTPSGRRVDEVDRLYALPNSISLIAHNLSLYLSTIFVAGEWSAKPLFLRGIYFTSSIREGSALDQELAQAVGVSVDQLPAGRAWEREHSRFLRDLFLEKIFPEWGLVTRASDTKRMLRGRMLALFAVGLASLMALLLFSWAASHAMEESLGYQSGYWLRASDGWTTDNTMLPIVKSQGNGQYTYEGDTRVGAGSKRETAELFEGRSDTLVEFHAKLRKLSEEPLNISWVFRPFYTLASNLSERKRAQRVVFEGSVIKPLVDAARDKMATPNPQPATQAEAEAFLSLVRVEAGILKRRDRIPNVATPEIIVPPLQKWVCDRDFDPSLAQTMDWIYGSGDGVRKWPEDGLTGGGSLLENKAIAVGLDRFIAYALNATKGTEAKLETLLELRDFIKQQLAPKEQDLFQAAGPAAVAAPNSDQALDPRHQAVFERYKAVEVKLDARLRDTRESLFANAPASLNTAYERLIKERSDALKTLHVVLDELLEETNRQAASHPSFTLFREIQEKLSALLQEIEANSKVLTDAEVRELQGLDDNYLVEDVKAGPVYAYRGNLYQASFDLTQPPAEYQGMDLIGDNLKEIKAILDRILTARRNVADYPGASKAECEAICASWLDYAETTQGDAFCQAYFKQAKAKLQPLLYFPLVWPPEDQALTLDQLKAANKLVGQIHQDLQSDTFGKVKGPARPALAQLDQHLSLLDPVLRALFTPANEIRHLQLSLPVATADAPKLPGVEYELRLGTPVGGEHGNLGGKGLVPIGKGEVLVTGIPISQVFHLHSYFGGRLTEVWCGKNWCALRLLAQDPSPPPSGGADWVAKFNDAHGTVLVDIEFEQAMPGLAQWPSRQSIGLGE